MNDNEKLTKVIEYAVGNGYSFNVSMKYLKYVEDEAVWFYRTTGGYFSSLESVIFSKSFCQAVFGDNSERPCEIETTIKFMKCSDQEEYERTHLSYGRKTNIFEPWNYQRHQLLDLDSDSERIEYLFKYING